MYMGVCGQLVRVSSFLPGFLWVQIQVFWLVSKHLYQMSHLISPNLEYEVIIKSKYFSS